MNAEYKNGFAYEECTLLAHNLNGTMCLIELDGVRGWCSACLIEEGE